VRGANRALRYGAKFRGDRSGPPPSGLKCGCRLAGFSTGDLCPRIPEFYGGPDWSLCASPATRMPARRGKFSTKNSTIARDQAYWSRFCRPTICGRSRQAFVTWLCEFSTKHQWTNSWPFSAKSPSEVRLPRSFSNSSRFHRWAARSRPAIRIRSSVHRAHRRIWRQSVPHRSRGPTIHPGSTPPFCFSRRYYKIRHVISANGSRERRRVCARRSALEAVCVHTPSALNAIG